MRLRQTALAAGLTLASLLAIGVATVVSAGLLLLAFEAGHARPVATANFPAATARPGTPVHEATPSLQAAGNYVPWLPLAASDVTPTPLPTLVPSPPIPVPSGTPPCTAGQLEGARMGGNGGGGHTVEYVQLRNRSNAACVLSGFPDASVLDGNGNVLDEALGTSGRGTWAVDRPSVPVLMETGTPRVNVPYSNETGSPGPPGQASITIEFVNCAHPRAAQLVLQVVPSRQRLHIPFPVSGYQGVCFGPGEQSVQYQLNCAGAPTVPAAQAITFQMQLAIPATVPLGATTLTWALSDQRLSFRASADATLQVTG